MENDLENLLEKVIVPIKDQSNLSSRLFLIRILKVIGNIVVVLGISFAVISKLNNSNTQDDSLKRISKLILLPNEPPTIVTLTEADPLKSNLFFKDAKNGDKLFLFDKSGRAILYSTTLNKIINTGSIKDAGLQKI